MKKNILFIGYGISPIRKEAVSISTNRLIKILQTNGSNVYCYSISPKKTFLHTILNRKKIIEEISGLINAKNIEIVHDVFVLYLPSVLITLRLKKIFRKVKFIKTIQNRPGFSLSFTFESFIRMIGNNLTLFKILAKKFDLLTTSIKLLSKERRLLYVPQLVNIYKPSKRNLAKVINICFLGHPLKKKGIGNIIKYFDNISEKHRSNFTFNFAFSRIGNLKYYKSKIIKSCKRYNIKYKFWDDVKPHVFFRNNDAFLLPIKDEFSATSVPNTILEAMEAGCGVITVKNNIIKEEMSGRRNCLLLDSPSSIDIGRSLEWCLANSDKFAIIRKNARNYILNNYSNSKIYKNILKCYE